MTNRSYLMVPCTCWLLLQTTIKWILLHNGSCGFTRSLPSSTLLEIVLYALRCSIVYDSVDVSKVDAHSQCHNGKNYPLNSVWSGKTLQGNFLVVLRCVGMKHTKKAISLILLAIGREVRSITQFIVKMGIQISTHIQSSAVDYNSRGHSSLRDLTTSFKSVSTSERVCRCLGDQERW